MDGKEKALLLVSKIVNDFGDYMNIKTTEELKELSEGVRFGEIEYQPTIEEIIDSLMFLHDNGFIQVEV